MEQLTANYSMHVFCLQYESLTEETIDRKKHPLIDYTPPEYLTLLFTDIGILTPTAVSDELIKLA